MIFEFTIAIILMLLFFKTKHLIFVIVSILYMIYKIRDNKNKKGFKLLLLLYFIGLVYFLFFDSMLARIGNWDFIDFKSLKLNLIPFKTIMDYLKAMFNIHYAYIMNYENNALFLNIIGNFFCIAPLGILLPLSFDKFKGKKNYLISSLIICIILELIQCISMNGSFDIDDLILNYSGAVLAFYLSINEFIPFVENILLEQENSINYKRLIIKVVIVIIISTTLVFCFIYRDNKEKEFIKSIDNYEIKYTGEYQDNYTELIYEDEYFEYYLNHYRKDDIKIIIVGEEYSLQDYLDEKTIALPNCEKLIAAGLDISRKEKATQSN